MDDAFYYWMIARHVVAGNGFTFDGINPTNGFQPLWQWILLLPGLLERDVQLRVSLMLGAVFYQATAWLLTFWRLQDKTLQTILRFAAVCLWINARFVFDYASSGMEFGLYMFVATLAFLFVCSAVEQGSPNIRQIAAVSVTLSLVPLARIDGLALSGLLAISLITSCQRKNRLSLLVASACSLVPFIVWMAINELVFSSPLPVSGRVKMIDQLYELDRRGVLIPSVPWCMEGVRATTMLVIGNFVRFLSGWLPPGPWNHGLIVIGSVLGVLALGSATAWKRPCRPTSPARFVFFVPILFLLVQAVTYSFMIPEGTHYAQWYYGPSYLALALVSGWFLHELPQRLATIGGLILLSLQLIALCLLNQPVQLATQGVRSAIARLEEATGTRPVIVGSWNSGIIAFRAPGHVTVVNLDGLVNTKSYAENWAIGTDKRGYLEQENVEYIIDYSVGENVDTWHDALRARLYADAETSLEQFNAIHVGELPGGGTVEQRRYHVIRFKPDS